MLSCLKSPLIATATLALISAMPAQAQERPGEGVTITMARPTWDTGWFHTKVYRQMLAELGYTTTEPMTLDNPAFYQAVGYGDVTMWVDGWFPNHDPYRSAFEDGAEIVGAVALGGAMEGYMVSMADAERLNITSLEDFKRDEVKQAFDRNGDGKADLVGCPPGWACEMVQEHHLDAYDLRDHVNLIKAGYSVSMADTVAAYESGEPVFFYAWTPNWTMDEEEAKESLRALVEKIVLVPVADEDGGTKLAIDLQGALAGLLCLATGRPIHRGVGGTNAKATSGDSREAIDMVEN